MIQVEIQSKYSQNTVKIHSPFTMFQVDVQNRTAEADLLNYTPNGEWTLIEKPSLIRHEKTYPNMMEPFPEIVVKFQIRRKTLYYMYNIVFPCMMMSTLTVLVFCLPPDSGEKIALGVTVLLAFSVFMLAIAEKMPETSESIPLIGNCLSCLSAVDLYITLYSSWQCMHRLALCSVGNIDNFWRIKNIFWDQKS